MKLSLDVPNRLLITRLAHDKPLSPEVSLESVQNVRARHWDIEINEILFSIDVFEHIGVDGAAVSFLVQELSDLSYPLWSAIHDRLPDRVYEVI